MLVALHASVWDGSSSDCPGVPVDRAIARRIAQQRESAVALLPKASIADPNPWNMKGVESDLE
jgi:hypothetical protein